MNRIFGKRQEKAPPPNLSDTTTRLTTRGDTLDDKIRKLDEQLIKHREAIQRCRPGPAQDAAKRRALNVLKQKRLYENQRDQLYNQQFNVEQTSFMMENVQDSVQTVQAMKAAGKELRQAFKRDELNISNIDKLQDDMADIMDMHNDIQDVLGQNYGVPDDIDEDELLGELDALEADMAFQAEESVAHGAVPAYLQEPELPAAPHMQQHEPIAEGDFGLPAVPQRT
jgi:charged multivesicular body protein 5